MSGWVKLDESFFLHPKALAAGRDARDVYLAGLCWSNMQRTNGEIPAHALALIAGLAGVADPDQAASRLCEVGLWTNEAGGWSIHDFLVYQQSKEDREAWLEGERARKAEARRRKAEAARNAAETIENADVSANVPRGQSAESAKRPRDVRSRDVDVDVDVDVEDISLSLLVPLGGPPSTAKTDRSIDQRITDTYRAWLRTQAGTLGIPPTDRKRMEGYIQSSMRTIDQHWPALKALAQANPTTPPDQLAALYRKPKP